MTSFLRLQAISQWKCPRSSGCGWCSTPRARWRATARPMTTRSHRVVEPSPRRLRGPSHVNSERALRAPTPLSSRRGTGRRTPRVASSEQDRRVGHHRRVLGVERDLHRVGPDLGSRSPTRKPVTPGSINVIRPPTSLATTGVPQAEDSNATSPKLSSGWARARRLTHASTSKAVGATGVRRN